jgi:hypothetical protein
MALQQPILTVQDVSPDGKWLSAWAPVEGTGTSAFQAFPLDGGSATNIGSDVLLKWPLDNSSVFISSAFDAVMPEGRSYVVPVRNGHLPPIPPGGFRSEEEISRVPAARRLDLAATMSDVIGRIALGPSSDVYAFYRSRAQRNLYRIPVP